MLCFDKQLGENKAFLDITSNSYLEVKSNIVSRGKLLTPDAKDDPDDILYSRNTHYIVSPPAVLINNYLQTATQ